MGQVQPGSLFLKGATLWRVERILEPAGLPTHVRLRKADGSSKTITVALSELGGGQGFVAAATAEDVVSQVSDRQP